MFRVFLFELRRNITRKGYLFMTFGVPLIAAVLLFGYNAIQQANADAGDGDDTPAPLEFGALEQAGFVDHSGLIDVVPDELTGFFTPYETEEAARAALDSDEIDAYYVIPEDYVDEGIVQMVVPQFGISVMETTPVQRLILDNLAGDVDPIVLTRLRNPAIFQTVNLSRTDGNGDAAARDAEAGQDADFLLMYVLVISFLMGIFITSGYLMQSVIEEKETRLVEILIATVRPMQLLLGKVLALGLLGLMQIVVWLISVILIIVIGAQTSGIADIIPVDIIIIPWGRLPILLVYFILGYLLFAVLYGAIGALSTSSSDGPQYAVLFTLPAAIPFYFFMIFITSPHAPVPVILSMFPLTSPVSMIMRLSITDVPFIEVVISLALLALAVLGAAWIAGRLFRVQILLSGQTPKLKELPGLIFRDRPAGA